MYYAGVFAEQLGLPGDDLRVRRLDDYLRENSKTPLDYSIGARALCRGLQVKEGEYKELDMTREYLAGRVTPQTLQTKSQTPAAAPSDPRQVHVNLFYSRLEGVPEERRRVLARELELGCYNAVIRECLEDSTIIRSWESPTFVGIYATRCGVVASALSCSSQAAKQYGTSARDKLISGAWSPSDLGEMAARDLRPEASEKERAEIEIRQQQQVQARTSQMYRCPNCRGNKCTYREVQTRASDEAATIFCTCLDCNTTFTG